MLEAKGKLQMVNKVVGTKAVILVIMSLTVCAHGKPIPVHPPMGLTSAPSMAVGEWTASDRPYKDLEHQMAKDFANGKNPQAILQECQRLAVRRPKDPVAQFAAMIAARGAYRVANPGGILPYELVETLAKNDPGNVHEYARFRFCMTEEAEKQLPLRDTEVIGEKLLQYNPKDDLVRINLIYMLCDANHAQAALPYAQQWVKTDPNSEKAHSSLALVYEDIWFKTKKRGDADKAVAEYQQFLRFAPPNDGFRQHAEHLIETIRAQSMSQR